MAKKWTLDDGVKLVRALQGRTREYGYHLTLGGSVVNKGESEKDVDLYFLPMNNSKIKEDPNGLVSWLEGLWGNSEPIGNEYEDGQPNKADQYWGLPKTKIVQDNPMMPIWHLDENQAINFDSMISFKTVPYYPTKSKSGVKSSVYKFKLKFTRSGDERIDVFIL